MVWNSEALKMIIRKIDSVTNVPNQIINADNLSFKARGIFVYLWAQVKNGGEQDFKKLVQHTPEGTTSIRSGLKELENKGYLKRDKKRYTNGQYKESFWILSEYGDLK
ncbi:DnaA [Lactobacillus pasteurii DSM 23907 = CRBIP 24.76]|uniref:DnaA n=2 Tax=Lactobacillus pasteurii TaxID=872327 RepID=I7LB70_9LACO|nr:DnaA [Lactobacillus pasteurii DSM 23907 = CRBIP 24.76]